ncbi:thioesterase superfamily domain-containing protein [Ditylenchus destructor]|nr:thioesterase superfamily domain-containing protein [Ditylenchus destructor]
MSEPQQNGYCIAEPASSNGEENNEEFVAEMQKHFDKMAQSNNFSRVAGKLKVVKATKNKLVVELLLLEEHVNSKGTLHGGLTAALVDIITARAVGLTVRDTPMVSMDISVSYMLPAKLGDVVVIEADCLKIGRNIAFTEATFRRKSDNALVAKGKHNISFLHHLKQKVNQF